MFCARDITTRVSSKEYHWKIEAHDRKQIANDGGHSKVKTRGGFGYQAMLTIYEGRKVACVTDQTSEYYLAKRFIVSAVTQKLSTNDAIGACCRDWRTVFAPYGFHELV